MSSRRRRPRPSSPAAAPPLEDDNLLSEILLRLPPLPSSLPRASAVSKRWLRLVSFPGFLRRFRIHHCRNPPLLGFFDSPFFEPAMDPPNRIPDDRVYSCLDVDDGGGPFSPIGCRHGLVLIFHDSQNQILVRDPFNGDKHRLTVPRGFDVKEGVSGAVFRAVGDIQHFQVVLVGTETTNQHHTRAIACVYSSEAGGWGDLISLLLPPKASRDELPTVIYRVPPGVLVGRSLYWLLTDRSEEADRSDGILEFDLERQVLAVIPVPVDIADSISQLQIMRAEGGGLGILFLSKFSAQLWKMETDSDGVASWVLGRTIALDKLLSMKSKKKKKKKKKKRGPLILGGFAEYNNVVFLQTRIALFTIQLESLQFKRVSKTNILTRYHPFECVYAAGTGIGVGHDGTELLHNT